MIYRTIPPPEDGGQIPASANYTMHQHTSVRSRLVTLRIYEKSAAVLSSVYIILESINLHLDVHQSFRPDAAMVCGICTTGRCCFTVAKPTVSDRRKQARSNHFRFDISLGYNLW